MKVVWEKDALRDLEEIFDYIALDDLAAAVETGERITQLVGQLGEAPWMGRPGRVSGTRELIVPGSPYLVPYRVKRKQVQILRVFHAARRAPDEW